jgi:hypothetical protein
MRFPVCLYIFSILLFLGGCRDSFIEVSGLRQQDGGISDASVPVDNTADAQFTDASDNNGNNIGMTWTAFSDNVAVTDHQIILYTDPACSTGALDQGLTGSSGSTDNGIINDLANGTYYATVTAFDGIGNSTTSACSTDTIRVSNPETILMASDGASGDRYAESVSISGNNVLVGARWDDGLSGSAYLHQYNPSTGLWGELKLTPSDGTAERFGTSVSISENSALVGARGDGIVLGSAYLYQYNPDTGNWDETKLLATDGVAGDNFGASVSISENNILIGADANDDAGFNSGSAYLYQYNPATYLWDEVKITASDADADDNFGRSVAISGNNAVVGSSKDDDNGSNSGSVYLYQYNPNTGSWDEVKLTASDGDVNDWFGGSVAISGNNIVVGASGDDDNGSSSGSVYLYQYNPNMSTWDETKITASDGAADDNFGSVAISENSILIGASGDTSYAGSAYLFQKNPSTGSWDETKITASDGTAYDFFGSAIGISGNTSIIGAYRDPGEGSAYVYDITEMQSMKDFKLTASDGLADDYFGASVAVSGSTVIVGANGVGPYEGAAYLYQYNPNTGLWDEVKLTGSDTSSDDRFGAKVAISENNALVGAFYHDANGTNSGAAYLFQYNPNTGAWDETKLLASDGSSSDAFGSSVSISGNNALLGAYGDDDYATDSGAAYLFQYNPTSGAWDELKIVASDAGVSSAWFGDEVAISGNTALISAPGDNVNGAWTGAAYFYQFNPATGFWDESKVMASDSAAGEWFGSSVAISGNNAIVGADGSGPGSAYIFQYNNISQSWDEVKLTASDGANGHTFGESVAISGNLALVGAVGDDYNGSQTGSSYLYQFNPVTRSWVEEKLTLSDGASLDRFGGSVSLSEDRACIAASRDDDNAEDSGSVSCYQID